ncbi:MAG TPA: hypothetical protein VMP03_08270, partial [Methylomirabilota bacterium]|nr:hypothetical protein [Methylomirabilota bacterium]
MLSFPAHSLASASVAMVRVTVLALFLFLGVLIGAASAESGEGDLATRIRAAAGIAYAAEQAQLARLRTSTDPSAAVQLARLLKSGLRVSPTNPLRVSHEEEAVSLLRKTIVLPGAAGAEAAAVLGAILIERAGSADREEAIAMLRRAARSGDGSSAVRLADAILANRFGDPAAEAEAGELYASALAKREPGAAQGFARLAADPDLAATYRRQGMMLLKLRAEKSGSSAFQLAEAYRTGFGIDVDRDAARRHYREALSLGYGPAVPIFVSAGVAPDEEVVSGLAEALSAGSKEAALAIVRAYLNRSVLPVTGEDARFAISLLREIRNPDAGIIEARLLLTGRDPFTVDEAAAEAVVDTVIADGVANPVTLLNYGRQLRDLPNAQAGPRIAMKIFLAAARGGEPLGAVHAVELLAEQDVDVTDETRREAMRALEAFADAGDGRSLVLLADLYRDGDGVERSASMARTLYGRAIDLAEEPAAYERLASLMLETAYDASDLREAMDLYAAAADAGSAGATAAIGRIYISGRGEIAPNRNEGERLLMQAAENGYTAALVQLADHLRDTGNAADAAKAESLYRRALESGEAGGGVGLANLLLARGDRDAALPLFRDAVVADDPSAMVGLARWLLSGTPDEDDVQEARDLVGLARRTAADDTRTLLDVAGAAFGFPDDETRVLGLDILVRLAGRGDSEARRRLVRAHVNGDVGRRDKNEAMKWAGLALKDGTVEPAVLLGEAMLAGDSPELADPVRGRAILAEVLAVAPE